MTNEEKILAALEKLQADVDEIKTELNIKKSKEKDERKEAAARQLAIFEAMAALLTDEEKDALGRYQEAEEARKAALYG